MVPLDSSTKRFQAYITHTRTRASEASAIARSPRETWARWGKAGAELVLGLLYHEYEYLVNISDSRVFNFNTALFIDSSDVPCALM